MGFCIIIFLCLMLSYMIVLFLIFRLRAKIQNQIAKQKNGIDINKQIMDQVKTNQTYPNLQDTISRQNDAESHMTPLNVNFGGYFKIQQNK